MRNAYLLQSDNMHYLLPLHWQQAVSRTRIKWSFLRINGVSVFLYYTTSQMSVSQERARRSLPAVWLQTLRASPANFDSSFRARCTGNYSYATSLQNIFWLHDLKEAISPIMHFGWGRMMEEGKVWLDLITVKWHAWNVAGRWGSGLETSLDYKCYSEL